MTNFDHIVNEVRNAGRTVIVGAPGIGKSDLASRIVKAIGSTQDEFLGCAILPPNLIRSDNYESYGWEQSLYKMMKDLEKQEVYYIVEGVQAARLLRKGLETGKFRASLIIRFVFPAAGPRKALIEHRYATRRKLEGKPVKPYPEATAKGIDTVFNEYWAKEPNRPLLIEINEDV